MRIIEWLKRIWAAEKQKMQKGGLNPMPPTIPRPSKPPRGHKL